MKSVSELARIIIIIIIITTIVILNFIISICYELAVNK